MVVPIKSVLLYDLSGEAQLFTRFVIRFIPTTTIHEVLTAHQPSEVHAQKEFNHPQALANTYFELPGIGSYFASQVYKKQSSTFIYAFKAPLSATSPELLELWSIFSLTSNFYLNFIPANKFYFDTTIPAIEASTE
ncbi:hypothetical protein IGI04_024695, partial [Brassica rapa subsp. trilocularis]